MKKSGLPYCLSCFLLAEIFFSCHPAAPTHLFAVLPASQTHIDFVNKPLERETLGILYYLYYYNGGGVAVNDVNGDGLPDIYFSANRPGGNKLFLNKGHFNFEDVTEAAGVAGTADWSTGVTIADVNGDGKPDIYVCAVAHTHGLQGHNELFINNGNGSFSEQAAAYGLDFSGYSTQAAFFDYDNDGDLDCYLLNQSSRPNQNIRDTSGRRQFDSLSGDRLYRNDNGHFTEVGAAAGIYQSNLGYGLGLAVADFNNDGWPDIYIGNDFHENDYYYVNNGNGTFTESGASHFHHYSRFSMGNDAADIDNDGQPDLVTVDMLPPDEKTLKTYGSDEHFDIYNQKILANGYQPQVSRNCLQKNNGDGSSFSDVALMSGMAATDWSWAPLLADFDNDGNKDLFISSGIPKRPVDLDYIKYRVNPEVAKALNSTGRYDAATLEKIPDGASHPFLFRGSGGIAVTDVSAPWGTADLKGYYNGAAYADLDNDGKLDLVVNVLNAPALVLRNEAPEKHFLSVSFKGENKNPAGIGAKCYLFSGGKMQYQQLMLTRGFMSSGESRLHFGLDSLAGIDSLLLVWPGNKYQVLYHLPADSPVIAEESAALPGFVYQRFFPPARSPLTSVVAPVAWTQHENAFVDFNSHYLIPHMESTRGPKLAVADVNKDGLDDFFICGPAGQAGALMIQTRSGQFASSNPDLFAKNKASEGVGATFFDANGDGYPDLYVVSGGNQLPDGDPGLADHLYLNDGHGRFSEKELPPMLVNKSCVAAADVNHDGFTDLFVGGFSAAESYGLPQPAYLLLNDGKGNFHRADSARFPPAMPGMVTAAGFADLDHDGWDDLVVAGEWMPVTVYHNDQGRLVPSAIPGSSGLWQSLDIADVNGDGYPDLLAGNWGENSKLWAGKTGPLKLYVKDFDRNGTVEQVMTYTIDGQEYPFLAKDELEHALPVLKKAYLTYGEVAGKTVQFLLDDLLKDYKMESAETLASACFFGDGKGRFSWTDLPGSVQQAPVFAFAPVPAVSSVTKPRPLPVAQWLAGGNFYGVLPYEGRYDALPPTFFSFTKQGIETGSTLRGVDGEIRDMQWVRGANGTATLVVARNNAPLIFLRTPNESK